MKLLAHTLACLLAFVWTSVSISANWVVVDRFEDPALPGWHVHIPNMDNPDRVDPNNPPRITVVPDPFGGSGNALEVFPGALIDATVTMFASLLIPEEARIVDPFPDVGLATLYMRVARPQIGDRPAQVFSGWGLVGLFVDEMGNLRFDDQGIPIRPTTWGHFSVMSRMETDGSLDVRDDSQPAPFVKTTGSLTTDVWYELWHVINHPENTFRVFIRGGPEFPGPDPVLLYPFAISLPDAVYRAKTFEDLAFFMIGTSTGSVAGGALGIDPYFISEIHIDPTGKNLTRPLSDFFIRSHPSDTFVSTGGEATFAVDAESSSTTAYRWQVSIDGGETFANVSDGGFFGATLAGTYTDSLTIANLSGIHDGLRFRVRVSSDERILFSQAALLSVRQSNPPIFLAQPVSSTTQEQGSAVFSVEVDGFPAPSVRWQVSTDGDLTFSDLTEGEPFVGVETPTLQILPVTLAMNGHRFRAVAENSAGIEQSAAASLTVTPLPFAPTIVAHPEDQASPEGSPVVFVTEVSGNPTPVSQWQISFDGGQSFSNITDGSFGGNLFRNTQTNSLTILSASSFLDGALFRIRASNSEGVTFSQSATLTISSIESLETWLSGSGVPSDRRHPLDRHGPLQLTNLMAYALGLPPFEATPADLPRVERESNGSGLIRFSYRVNTRSTGADVAIEESVDLLQWDPAEPTDDRLVWELNGVQGREAVFDQAGDFFLRLRIGPEASAPTNLRLSGDLDFGHLKVGESTTRTLTIHNDGGSPITVSSITYTNAAFTGAWSGVIPAGSSRDVTVTFTPTALSAHSGTLTVNSDAASGANVLPLSGIGTATGWERIADFESEDSLDAWHFSNRLSRNEVDPEDWDSSYGTVPRPFDDMGGNALAVSEGSVLWQVFDVGIHLGQLPVDNTFTLFYEIALSDLTPDVVAGLHTGIPEDWFFLDDQGLWRERYGWAHYSTLHRMGRLGMNAYNGFGYSPSFSEQQMAQTWYRFWMVVDPLNFTWNLYVQGGEFAEITLVADDYYWRNMMTFEPLETFRVRIQGTIGGANAATTSGEPTYLDNLFLDRSGTNLSLPPFPR